LLNEIGFFLIVKSENRLASRQRIDTGSSSSSDEREESYSDDHAITQHFGRVNKGGMILELYEEIQLTLTDMVD